MAHGWVPAKSYFLIATADRFFLWTDDAEINSPPEYEQKARDIGAHWPILNHMDEANREGLELLISAWLNILTHLDHLPNDDWLIRSGLFDAIKHGTVQMNNAA